MTHYPYQKDLHDTEAICTGCPMMQLEFTFAQKIISAGMHTCNFWSTIIHSYHTVTQGMCFHVFCSEI